jgi:ATP-dependent DNA helicase RecQ
MSTTEHRHQGKKVLSDVHRLARERFGFEQLRPGQAETIVSVLQGRDTLAVMATGSAKSAICQIAGLLTNGPTVVISPLLGTVVPCSMGRRIDRSEVKADGESGSA